MALVMAPTVEQLMPLLVTLNWVSAGGKLFSAHGPGARGLFVCGEDWLQYTSETGIYTWRESESARRLVCSLQKDWGEPELTPLPDRGDQMPDWTPLLAALPPKENP